MIRVALHHPIQQLHQAPPAGPPPHYVRRQYSVADSITAGHTPDDRIVDHSRTIAACSTAGHTADADTIGRSHPGSKGLGSQHITPVPHFASCNRLSSPRQGKPHFRQYLPVSSLNTMNHRYRSQVSPRSLPSPRSQPPRVATPGAAVTSHYPAVT